jgi:hypothetical protein
MSTTAPASAWQKTLLIADGEIIGDSVRPHLHVRGRGGNAAFEKDGPVTRILHHQNDPAQLTGVTNISSLPRPQSVVALSEFKLKGLSI